MTEELDQYHVTVLKALKKRSAASRQRAMPSGFCTIHEMWMNTYVGEHAGYATSFDWTTLSARVLGHETTLANRFAAPSSVALVQAVQKELKNYEEKGVNWQDSLQVRTASRQEREAGG
jgi:hypothetical protein